MFCAASSNCVFECTEDDCYVCVGLRKTEAVAGRVRLDSWSLSGLVGGFQQTPFSLRIQGGGFR